MKRRKRKTAKRKQTASRRRPGLAERLDRIAKECAALLKERCRSIDLNEMLYDEKGLPK